MNNVMSIIFASDNESKLNELTIHRTTASLPFLGRYRLIDFTLSNLVNSGITTIGIVTRNNYSSLMDHIRMGRDWDLNRKNSGIAVFPPFVLNTSREMYKGKIEALYSILDYFKRAREDYVVLSNSNIAMNIDIEEIFAAHIKSGADITMLVHKSCPTTSRRIIVEKCDSGRVRDMYISEMPDATPRTVGLNVYIIKKSKLIDIIEGAYARGYMDFEKDILMKRLDELFIRCYEVTGYSAIIDDIKTYYAESMRLLDNKILKSLFYNNGIIFTKVKDSVPTMYGESADVKNSLIADGCEINGTVINSILFRGVKVEQNAVIKNSIVMENGHIMRYSTLSYAITDKNVIVRENRSISGYETYPVVIVKDKIV